jgi:hypothetical protein
MSLSSLIGAGFGHIPKDSTAADGLKHASSILAIATVARVWSSRSAILGTAASSISPVIFQEALPVNEESTAALFALAAISPEPLPVLAQMEVRRRRRSMRQQTTKHEPSNVAGGINGRDLARNELRLAKMPAGIGAAVGFPGLPRDPVQTGQGLVWQRRR